jgi:MYXO-CTERM domain-containing protein
VTTVEARAVLFGFDASPVSLEVLPRSRRWRVVGAARALAVSLVVAPVVAVVPPHAPWAIGALAVGGYFARRRWTETHTLAGVDGACPKCGQPFRAKPSRLRRPHPLECEGCHHTSELRIPDGALSTAS